MMNDKFSMILTQCIDDIQKGEKTVAECIEQYPDYKDELADLLNVMQFVKDNLKESVDEDFRWRTRSTLVNRVVSHQPVTIWDKSRLRFRETFTLRRRKPIMQLIVIVTLLFSLVSGGSVLASENAIPGDFLYKVKLFVEEARLVLTGEEKEVELYLQFAEKRLREVESLAERGRFEGIGVALDRFENHIDGATRSIPAERPPNDIEQDWKVIELSDSIFRHQEVLQGLLDNEVVAEQGRGAIEHAIEVSKKGQMKLNEIFPEGPPAKGPPSIPPGEPELPPLPEKPVDPGPPDLPGIPTLPVELPVDVEDLPEDDFEDDGPPFPLPEPVEGQPGRP
jgi:hypothetical protein